MSNNGELTFKLFTRLYETPFKFAGLMMSLFVSPEISFGSCVFGYVVIPEAKLYLISDNKCDTHRKV